MKRPDGFAINGEVYPSYSIRTEIVMHKHIEKLEAIIQRMIPKLREHMTEEYIIYELIKGGK